MWASPVRVTKRTGKGILDCAGIKGRWAEYQVQAHHSFSFLFSFSIFVFLLFYSFEFQI
jgi:hypothetical protein